MKYVQLAERLLYEAGGSQLIAVTVAMLVVAVLLNVFARHRRREMRRAVLLYMVYFVGTLVQGALDV